MKKVFLAVLLVTLLSVGVFAAKTITVAAGAVGIELELAREAAAEFEALYPGVEVNVLDTPDMVQDRLGLYLQFFEAQSDKVDVYQVDVIWPGDLAQHFVDLYQYGGHDYAPNHFDAIVDNNTVDGRLVAIPWFTDAGLLYYRADLLKKYGFENPPTTWDELENIAKTVQAGESKNNPDFWGFVFQGNAYEGLTCDALEWVASNNGGTIINRDKEITIANSNAAEILDQVAGWVGTIAPEGVLSFAEEDARKVFQGGNAMFMRNWPYAYMLGQGDDSAVKGKFDVCVLPHGKGSSAATLGGWQLAVSKYSKDPALAAQVAFFFANYAHQKDRAIKASYNPTIKTLYQDKEVLEAVPFFGTLYDVFTNAVARPSTASAPKYNEVSTLFFKAVYSIISGESNDTMGTLEELALDIEEVTGYTAVFE